MVLDKNGNLMPGQVGLSRLDVFAQANSKSAIVQDKDNNNLYYIYTLGTNSKLYRHQVNMSAPGNGTADAPLGDVIATNELLVSEADFVPAMAWARVRTGTAKDLLYMLRSTSNTPDNLQLEAYDITSGTPARTLLASLPGNTDVGEIRLSPNGQYMAVAVNRGLQTGFFDFTSQGSEIRVYHVGTDYQSITLVNTIQTGTNANALSFDFGPDSRYIYYVSASQGNGYQVSRVVTSTSNIENVASLGNPASIARAGNNKLYVAAAGAAALTEIDHTPAGAASLRNIPVNTDGYQLSGILPLQPHTITPEGGVQMIFSRKLDAKSYELKDHLGNVRAVVSDRKLSDLSGSAIPYTLTNFHPGILAASNYYPFGMEMPGRNYNAPDYRYGFNGMEKDDEVTGTGNLYTAEFWEYDVRNGRRWNLDPVDQISISNYACFSNNPILRIDPKGNDDYTIDEKGHIALAKKTDDKNNTIYNHDKSGNIKVGLDFFKHHVESTPSQKKSKVDATFIVGTNMEDMNKAYKFFADNTNVEWNYDVYKDKAEVGVLATSHTDGSVENYARTSDVILSKYKDIKLIYTSHSHPGIFNSKTGYPAYPSGFSDQLVPEPKDPGDRDYYSFYKREFTNRIPSMFDIYVPSSPLLKVQYDDQIVIRFNSLPEVIVKSQTKKK